MILQDAGNELFFLLESPQIGSLQVSRRAKDGKHSFATESHGTKSNSF